MIGSLIPALEGGQAEEVSPALGRRRGALDAPEHGGGVVTMRVRGFACDVDLLAQDGLVDECAREF
jgi:hypothetical protein